MPEWHEKCLPVLEAAFGAEVPRLVNEKATASAKARAKDATKVDPVMESYPNYSERVKAFLVAAKRETEWNEYDREAKALAAATPVDASPAARSKGPNKEFIAKADDILSRADDAIEATVTKLLTAVDGFELQRDEAGKPDRTSLARLVGAYMNAEL